MRKKSRTNTYPEFQEPLFKRWMQIGFLTMVFIAVFVMLLLSAIDQRRVLKQSTRRYLQDVTGQMTGNIKETFEYRIMELVGIADTISLMDLDLPYDEFSEYLNNKAQALGFDPIILIDGNGNFISSTSSTFPRDMQMEDFLRMPSVQASFAGEVQASYTGGQNIFYSAPVYREQQISGVIIGVRPKEVMQKMIESKSFDGHGLSCIIEANGQVILSPTDILPFLWLDDIFSTNSDKGAAADIHKMLEDMSAGRNGVLAFTAVSGEELFLAYNALGVNDWVLLTLIPANIISKGADQYVQRTFIIVAVSCAIFSLFLCAVYYFFNLNRRQLEHFAFIDPVTGGLSNTGFQLKYHELSQTISPGTYTVVLVDVKGFKLINEKFGPEIGNALLSYLQHVMERHIDLATEFVARGEVDHFYICMKERVSEMVQSRLSVMVQDIDSYQGTELPHVSFSLRLGACLVDDPGEDILILQGRARMACQEQFHMIPGKCVFYDESFAYQLRKEQELDELFDESIANGYFHVYLQPKVLLRDDSLAGAEALVRWRHPRKGTIFPSDFIPLFERNGKILQLDMYMFENICMTLDRWRRMGRKLTPISINLSRRHFQEAGFLMRFVEIADRYKVPHGLIEFELTESIFFTDQQLDLVVNCIREMHALGFKCSLDDFGSGFSSLGLLKEFDVDVLKFDRVFFLDLSSERAKNVLVCLMRLAEKLHVQTVAEGIESEEQLAYLRSIHCDLVQGYVFSKPLPIPEFEAWAYHLAAGVRAVMGQTA